MMSPKVSVIIPVFNGEKFIQRCISSVIRQTYKNLEIIVIDDGSSDNTKNVVVDNFPSVSYLYQRNCGPAAARNLGINKSTGDYIAFIDADDVWLPEKISMQIEALRKNPKIKVVHTNIEIMNDGKVDKTFYPIDRQENKMFESLLLWTGSVVCSSILFSRECIEKVGNFDSELWTAEDVHLFLRMAYYYDFYFINQPLVIKYHHDSNLTNTSNIHYGSGGLLALTKIEQMFPDYSRKKSKVMRQALFLRARMRAIGYANAGDIKNALKYYIYAMNFNKTLGNFGAINYQIFKLIYNRLTKMFISCGKKRSSAIT